MNASGTNSFVTAHGEATAIAGGRPSALAIERRDFREDAIANRLQEAAVL